MKMKKILLILIISLMTTHMCFSNKVIHENNLNNLKIEYKDVKLIGSNRYNPRKIIDKNDNVVFVLSLDKKYDFYDYGTIVKTNECVIIFNNSYILYFYEVSLESIMNWYYSFDGLIPKPLMCKKVIVEIRR
jgi:hypothetical protein